MKGTCCGGALHSIHMNEDNGVLSPWRRCLRSRMIVPVLRVNGKTIPELLDRHPQTVDEPPFPLKTLLSSFLLKNFGSGSSLGKEDPEKKAFGTCFFHRMGVGRIFSESSFSSAQQKVCRKGHNKSVFKNAFSIFSNLFEGIL